jgi:hypothetical protein
MNTLVKVLGAFLQLILYTLAPFILIAMGAGMAGYGIFQDWPWLINGGIIVAALGVFWIVRNIGFLD